MLIVKYDHIRRPTRYILGVTLVSTEVIAIQVACRGLRRPRKIGGTTIIADQELALAA